MGLYPCRLGAEFIPSAGGWVFDAPQPWASPMMLPPWGQSMKFKVRALPDQFIWHFLALGEGWKSAAGDLFTPSGDYTTDSRHLFGHICVVSKVII